MSSSLKPTSQSSIKPHPPEVLLLSGFKESVRQFSLCEVENFTGNYWDRTSRDLERADLAWKAAVPAGYQEDGPISLAVRSFEIREHSPSE